MAFEEIVRGYGDISGFLCFGKDRGKLIDIDGWMDGWVDVWIMGNRWIMDI